jgi:beta-phosphoglucomutase
VFPATLFDYNGVLVDDESLHFVAMRDAVRDLGIRVSERDYWERYLGFDDVGALRAILQDAGHRPTAAQVNALVETKARLYLARVPTDLRVFAGATELVRRRATAGPVLIVSGALLSEIEYGLQVLQVADRIAGIIAAEDTTACKPDPQGYELGKRRLRQLASAGAAERALVVEDSIAGVEAAKAAGLPCIAVAHSYPATRLRAAGADWVGADLMELSDRTLQQVYGRLYG